MKLQKAHGMLSEAKYLKKENIFVYCKKFSTLLKAYLFIYLQFLKKYEIQN
jgi:hypothetical protein